MREMRKRGQPFFWFLSVMLSLALSACGGNGGNGNTAAQVSTTPALSATPTSKPTVVPTATVPPSTPKPERTLHIFAASSLEKTLTEIQALYQKEAPEIKLVFTFDSSGALGDQIEAGAICDLFFSASQRQMNKLVDQNQMDMTLRVDLLRNRMVLAVPEGNPAHVTSMEDLTTDAVQTLALGNVDAPVGQYAEEWLTKLGIWEAIPEKIQFLANAKEVTSQLQAGAFDCGITYATEALAAGLEQVVVASPDMLISEVYYPAAVSSSSAFPQEARAFLDYLQTEPCLDIFEAAGFSIPQ